MEAADDDILRQFARLRETGDAAIRDDIVVRHRWVAVHAARRFANRGESLDDLTQVATIGVLKAVDRFDPAIGTSFPAYALATAVGELRRHFRDATWAVRVPRRVKDLYVELSGAIDLLTHQLERSPRVSDLAEHLGVSDDQVLEAMEGGAGYRATSLSMPAENGDRGDLSEARVASEHAALVSAADRLTIEEILDKLPERERVILRLRFFEGLTQSEIAETVGVSQVHVSRLLRSSLAYLRRGLESSEDKRSEAGPLL